MDSLLPEIQKSIVLDGSPDPHDEGRGGSVRPLPNYFGQMFYIAAESAVNSYWLRTSSEFDHVGRDI